MVFFRRESKKLACSEFADVAASRTEEVVEQRSALICEDTAPDLRAMIQPTVTNDIPQRPDRTRLRLPRAEHNSVDTCENERARAHRAGFEGDGQGEPVQVPPVAVDPRGFTQRKYFGVRRRITRCLTSIGCTSEDVACRIDDNCTDRNIVVTRE